MSDPRAQTLFRLRCAFVKHGRLAYLGHLEVLHTIERIVRRAGLPFAVTQGFSPHMRAGFASALPVGTSSDAEYFDLFMTEFVPVPDALERLRAAAPIDLAPTAVCYIDVHAPALTAAITRVMYRIAIDVADGYDIAPERIDAAIAQLKEQGSIPYERGRKHKVLDLASTLVSWKVSAHTDGGLELTLDTRISNDGSLRPEILRATQAMGFTGTVSERLPASLDGKPVTYVYDDEGYVIKASYTDPYSSFETEIEYTYE